MVMFAVEAESLEMADYALEKILNVCKYFEKCFCRNF